MPVDTSERGTYHRLLDEKYAELEQILAELPAPALLWQPFANSPWQGPSNPLGAIVAHAVSSTVYLLHQAEYAADRREWHEVTGDEGREEFGPANHDPAYLLARVRRTQEYAQRLLAGFTPADLEGSRPHPKRAERIFTTRYCIQHAIEHLSVHIGHAQLTRQLWALQQAGEA